MIVIIWQCVISIPILYGIRHLLASSSYTLFSGLFVVLLLGKFRSLQLYFRLLYASFRFVFNLFRVGLSGFLATES